MSDRIRPTPEQRAAVEATLAAQPGSVIAVEAVAGSGKSTMLELGAAELRGLRKRMTYLAYNAPLAKQMKRRFGRYGAMVKTLHGAAHSAIFDRSRPYSAHRRGHGHMRGMDLAEALNLEGYSRLPGHRISSWGVGAMVGKTIARFCQSADTEIRLRHTTLGNYDPLLASDETGVRVAAEELRQHIFDKARLGWARIVDPRGDLDISHATYPKLFHLELLRVAAGYPARINIPRYLLPDVFLVDEAQDLNPVQIETVRLLSELADGAVTVLVGDTYQQIYAWRGATNALSRVAADVRLPLTRSFRFGEPIAELATEFVVRNGGRRDFVVRGNPAIQSTVREMPGFESAVLARTNLGAFNEAVDFLDFERPVYLPKAREIRSEVEDIIKLKNGGRPSPSSDYVLFHSYDELAEYAENEDPTVKRMLNLLRNYGDEGLLAILEECASPRAGAVEVCTAHSAKGKEWPRVRLSDDFHSPYEERYLASDGAYDEERNLTYVSITRAQQVLDASGAPHVIEAGEPPVATPEPVGVAGPEDLVIPTAAPRDEGADFPNADTITARLAADMFEQTFGRE